MIEQLKLRLAVDEENSAFTDKQLNEFIDLATDECRGESWKPGRIISKAYVMCLMSQALKEAGNEFSIADNGVTIDPPPVTKTILKLIELEIHRAGR